MTSGVRHSGLAARQFVIFIYALIISLSASAALLAGTEIAVYNESVTLFWTAPGDDGRWGRAAQYDIRCSTTEPGGDKELWWAQADTCTGEPTPSPVGYEDYFAINDLDSGQVYYFAIKTADEAGNWSAISNIVNNKYFPCADVNDDHSIDIVDIAIILNFLYADGPDLLPGKGDVDDSGWINMLDVVFLLNYKFKHGPDPICPSP